jgi:ubiquinone/menaquinone biosynthesis C-methylase UbiE
LQPHRNGRATALVMLPTSHETPGTPVAEDRTRTDEEIDMAVDQDRLMDLLGRFVGDLGATVSTGSVVIGERLGLYRALADGPTVPDALASRTGTDARYVAEWLRGQAASGYVEYDAATDTYSMTEEQAFALTDPDGPVFLPGAFQLALGSLDAVPRITEAFRTGEGLGWHEQSHDVWDGCERFFRPGYLANLVPSWIPALEGVEAKLRAGAHVADIGCGHGASTVLLAQQFPASTFHGSDYHDGSIESARKRAAEAGVSDRVTFEVASAQTFAGTGFDLACSFDCLHDMGDPVAAARHVREAIKPDGTWLVVEPFAGDAVADNINPVGRVYYSFSTLLCVPNAKSQGGLRTLGAQAGESAIRAVTSEAGFSRFRRAAETPFNLVYEVRP